MTNKTKVVKDVYGIKLFEELVEVLWKNRNQVEDQEYYFDYPEYGGLPNRISNKLSSDAVDRIQDFYDHDTMCGFKTKKSFEKFVRGYFFILS